MMNHEQSILKNTKRSYAENLEILDLSREGVIKGKCPICKRKKVTLTKHSLSGSHRPPYKLMCRICHDKIHKT